MKKLYSIALLVITGISLMTLSACRFNCVRGSGKKISENRKVADFTKIDISGSYKVNLKQDSSLALTITADDNLLKYIRTKVEGNSLHIYSKKNMCGNGQIVVNIGVRNLEEIKGSGAVEIASEGKINVKDVAFKLSGATKIIMDLNAANVITEGSGATEMILKGQASSHNISLSGGGDINALDFVVGSYKIETSGASHCRINVLHDLSIHTSGASEIEYRGNPVNFSNDKSGASTVKKIN